MNELTIVSKSAYARLRYYLSSTGRDVDNDRTVKACMEPVLLLTRMEQAVTGVFNEQWQSFRTLRSLAVAATDFEINLSNAESLNLSGFDGRYAGELIDIGNLIMAGIAVSMVGMDIGENSQGSLPNQASTFRKTLDSLVRSCAAAEHICCYPGRTEEILSLFEADGTVRSSRDVAVVLFATDPVEQARWHCLDLLFSKGTFSANLTEDEYTHWCESRTHLRIEALASRRALPGAIMRIAVGGIAALRENGLLQQMKVIFVSRFNETFIETALLPDAIDTTHSWCRDFFSKYLEETIDSNGQPVLILTNTSLRSEFLDLFVHITGITPDEVASIFDNNLQVDKKILRRIMDKAVYVTIPEDAEPGWIGMHESDAIERFNRYRSYLRDIWRKVYLPCLNGNAVPVAPYLNDLADTTIPLPAPGPTNRFDGGRPVIQVRNDTDIVIPGGTVDVSWISAGATHIEGYIRTTGDEGELRLTLPENGSRSVPVPNSSTTLTITLVPVNSSVIPVLYGKDAVIEIPVVVPEPEPVSSDNPADDEEDSTVDDVVSRERLALVIVRPAFIAFSVNEPERVSMSEVNAVLEEVSTSENIVIEPITLPYIPDTLSMVERAPLHNNVAAPRSIDDPVWDSVLERLCVHTMRSPGLEDAVWVAVVPPIKRIDKGRSDAIIRRCTMPTARTVAIVTPEGLRTLCVSRDKLPSVNLCVPEKEHALRCAFVWYRSTGIGEDHRESDTENRCCCPVYASIQQQELLVHHESGTLQEHLNEKEFRPENMLRRQWPAPQRSRIMVVGKDMNGTISLRRFFHCIPLSSNSALLCGLIPLDDTLHYIELHAVRKDGVSATTGEDKCQPATNRDTRLLKRYYRNPPRIVLNEVGVIEDARHENVQVNWYARERAGRLPRIAVEVMVSRLTDKEDVPPAWTPVSLYEVSASPIDLQLHQFDTGHLRLRIIAFLRWGQKTWTMDEPIALPEDLKTFAIRKIPSVIINKTDRELYWVDLYHDEPALEKEWSISDVSVVSGSVLSYKQQEVPQPIKLVLGGQDIPVTMLRLIRSKPLQIPVIRWGFH